MRDLPAGLTLDPIPADFAPVIEDAGNVLRWAGAIGGQRYALGLRPENTPAAHAKARADLRNGVWQLMEFARLGRTDLMAYAHVQRHTGRVIPAPGRLPT